MKKARQPNPNIPQYSAQRPEVNREVADTVEAMVLHRPYLVGPGGRAALEEITRDKGIMYNSEVVDACQSLFLEQGYNLLP